MAVTWYTSQGMPLDNVGVDGDMDFDFLGRFQWGPKKNGTWVGTANNVNPIYGPNFGLAPGFSQASVFLGTQSSTPTPTTQPLGGATATIAPIRDTMLYAVLVTSNVAGSYDVYNQTTGQVLVPSQAFPASATNYYGTQPFTNGQYTLLAGNVYVIRVTGSATGSLTGFTPVIAQPAMGLSQAVASPGLIGWSASQSFGTTGIVAPYYGSGVGAYLRPYRAGFFYNIVGTFTPTGTSTAANSVNIFMNAYSNSTNATTTYYNYGKVFATGKPTVLGTFNPQSLPIANASQYWYNINTDAACTGILQLDTQVVL